MTTLLFHCSEEAIGHISSFITDGRDLLRLWLSQKNSFLERKCSHFVWDLNWGALPSLIAESFTGLHHLDISHSNEEQARYSFIEDFCVRIKHANKLTFLSLAFPKAISCVYDQMMDGTFSGLVTLRMVDDDGMCDWNKTLKTLPKLTDLDIQGLNKIKASALPRGLIRCILDFEDFQFDNNLEFSGLPSGIDYLCIRANKFRPIPTVALPPHLRTMKLCPGFSFFLNFDCSVIPHGIENLALHLHEPSLPQVLLALHIPSLKSLELRFHPEELANTMTLELSKLLPPNLTHTNLRWDPSIRTIDAIPSDAAMAAMPLNLTFEGSLAASLPDFMQELHMKMPIITRDLPQSLTFLWVDCTRYDDTLMENPEFSVMDLPKTLTKLQIDGNPPSEREFEWTNAPPNLSTLKLNLRSIASLAHLPPSVTSLSISLNLKSYQPDEEADNPFRNLKKLKDLCITLHGPSVQGFGNFILLHLPFSIASLDIRLDSRTECDDRIDAKLLHRLPPSLTLLSLPMMLIYNPNGQPIPEFVKFQRQR